ncbi:Protein YIPF1 [Eumeta japonica]|uniref:Protein YIPF n=1 Tax=Eumeta variegata TaxID=151549 RepID=A0A4C1YMW9_EUMVA|nr:Protein YIPF1 [Eumeta japonica]
MSNVQTGQLLSFQDYSPEHNDRSARIDVEAVHTNQYTNTQTDPNFGYEEPRMNAETAAPQSNHNFWTIEYYQKYFDVQTSEVVERIISSVVPRKVPKNFFDEKIKGKPDLYGPVWISITLIFTIAVSANIANYLQSANRVVHWKYNFHAVSYAASAIFTYVWLVPIALWAVLKWTTVEDTQDDMETQARSSPSMMSLFCLYGYSLSIYIPVAILWTIQVSWVQWLFVLTAAFISGIVLIFWLLPALKKSRYFWIVTGCIMGFHFLLAASFMLYFFHDPNRPSDTI